MADQLFEAESVLIAMARNGLRELELEAEFEKLEVHLQRRFVKAVVWNAPGTTTESVRGALALVAD